MNPSARSLKKPARSLEKQVRQVLLAWNPIGLGFPVPADEYDCLVHKIVSSWFQGQSREQLQELIAREMTDHFGLPDALSGVDPVVEQVFALHTVIPPDGSKEGPDKAGVAGYEDRTPGRGLVARGSEKK
jgi:hypothetical protein